MRLITADRVATADGVVGDAVLVDRGAIVGVGQATELMSTDAERIHYEGATITPGLRDAHIHAVPYASLLNGCSLKAATSIQDLVDRLSSFAATLSSSEPVVATRFDDESLAERRLPTRHDLDLAVPDRPAVIYRYCGHIAVANTIALERSGIGASINDPEGGVIDRDGDGTPTGVLRETAMGMISGSLARGGGLPAGGLVDGLTRLAGLGITSIGAMIGYGERPSEQLDAELALWSAVADRLPIKVHGIVIADTPEAIDRARESLNRAGPRLRWLGLKRFADGSLGGHTAAMHEPFADVDTTGTLRLTELDEELARHALTRGGFVAIHAIGDRAVDEVLDLFERLIGEGFDARRMRVEHVSVISETQRDRLVRLGVTACVQPAFLASESAWVLGRVGSDREGWVYPFESMRRLGIPLAGSSDSPVEPPHPLWGMAAAIDRAGVVISEGMSQGEALRMFTAGGASALAEPPPLAIGSPADLTVLSVNPLESDADEIRTAMVLETIVDGDPVEVDRSLPTWVD